MARAAAASAGALGLAAGLAPSSYAAAAPAKARVVVIRHDSLAARPADVPPARLRELLDEAARALADQAKPGDAWARWFKPADRVAVKVNCLGYATHPAVALGLVQALEGAGLAPERATLWDRTSRELVAAGYEPSTSAGSPRCYGTDALAQRGNGGYTEEVYSSGATGSLISRIVTDQCTALVSASILKDHNLAGLTGAMKNFFGAIHNPNKYHDNNCDPFIADACAQEPIRSRLRLAVCDALAPQYHGGPASRPAWQWPYGGLIVGTDAVAVDSVAAHVLERKRAAAGMKSLAEENRPARYLASAEARGLGVADLGRIEVLSVGRNWLDVS